MVISWDIHTKQNVEFTQIGAKNIQRAAVLRQKKRGQGKKLVEIDSYDNLDNPFL